MGPTSAREGRAVGAGDEGHRRVGVVHGVEGQPQSQGTRPRLLSSPAESLIFSGLKRQNSFYFSSSGFSF